MLLVHTYGTSREKKSKEKWHINTSLLDGSFRFLHYAVRAISLILILQGSKIALFYSLSVLGPQVE